MPSRLRAPSGRDSEARRSTSDVLLRPQGKNQLLVAATDLNVSLTAELKSHNASDGGIAILAKNLFDLVASAPGDEVTLKKADNHWVAEGDQSSRFRRLLEAVAAVWKDRNQMLVVWIDRQHAGTAGEYHRWLTGNVGVPGGCHEAWCGQPELRDLAPHALENVATKRSNGSEIVAVSAGAACSPGLAGIGPICGTAGT